jgi:protein subunit release factor A
VKTKILSITIHDCRVDTFRSGGKGGQNQNKRETGVRVTHPPSGAVGESREHRTQLENKRAAFGRMARHARMTFWINRQTFDSVRFDESTIRDMTIRPEDFRVEQRVHGKWVELA